MKAKRSRLKLSAAHPPAQPPVPPRQRQHEAAATVTAPAAALLLPDAAAALPLPPPPPTESQSEVEAGTGCELGQLERALSALDQSLAASAGARVRSALRCAPDIPSLGLRSGLRTAQRRSPTSGRQCGRCCSWRPGGPSRVVRPQRLLPWRPGRSWRPTPGG